MTKRIALLCVVLLLGACAKQPGSATVSSKKVSPLKRQVTIGVILPLSGKYELYGQSSLQGIECAAGQKVPCDPLANVTLVVKDSAGDPEQAQAMVQELVTQHGVAAIVGPLLSKTVEVAAAEANRLGVPLVSLSQRDGVAELGEHVYRVGMNARSQVRAVTRYAAKKEKLQRFAVLYPNTRYGRMYRDLFRDAVLEFGGELAVERSYPEELGKVLAAHAAIKEAEESGQSRNMSRRFDFTEDGLVIHDYADRDIPKLQAIEDVDAIFFPGSYRTALSVVDAYGKDLLGEAKLLGVNRWNNNGILAGADAMEGSIFVGGFFSGSANRETQQFVDVFTQAYGVVPTYLEAQAYDAIHVIARATREGVATPSLLQSSLGKMRSFHGATGGMRFNKVGDVDKDLFVLTVMGGRILEVTGGEARRASVYEPGEETAPYETAERTVYESPQPTAAPVHEKYDRAGTAQPEPVVIPEYKYDDTPIDLAL